jgi:hypothetical protein
MTTRTYTPLVTITGRQPAHEQALADRIAAHLEIGSQDWAPFESATVDAVAGDRLRDSGHVDDAARAICRTHRALRIDDGRGVLTTTLKDSA